MSHQDWTDHLPRKVIVRLWGILLDQIVHECSDLRWNEVFLVTDRFSREGVLEMSPKGLGQYAITYSPTFSPLTAPIQERVQVNVSI
jgi:hypothetical protein